MSKMIISALMIALLTGCATTSNVKEECAPIVKTQVVKFSIRDEFLTIPPKVDPIDLNTATQKDVAKWLNAREDRTKILELKLQEIKNLINAQ